MASSKYIKIFNNHFMELIEDIITVFPYNMDLLMVKNSFIAIKKTNPKLIITSFHTFFSSKYEEQIDNGDIEFFINNNYEDDLKSSGLESSVNKFNEVFNKLRQPIIQMNEEDKLKVIKYIQNLKGLVQLYLEETSK